MLAGFQSCPICGQSFRGNSLKHHIKTCAKRKLTQLTACEHCARPILRDDLHEHAQRCKGRLAQRSWTLGGTDRDSFKNRCGTLQALLARVESGELSQLDSQGLFICPRCGLKGLGLLEFASHDECCRGSGTQVSVVASSPASAPDSTQEIEIDSSTTDPRLKSLAAVLKDTVQELETQLTEGDELAICLDRLRDVTRNARDRDEKKYRRLRQSNGAFHEAIGRWPAAVLVLTAAGFVEAMHASKGAEAEPYLVLEDRLPDDLAAVVLDALDGKFAATASTPDLSPSAEEEVTLQEAVLTQQLPDQTQQITDQAPQQPVQVQLEQCAFCGKEFRFDRIAKHETRCVAAKPKIAKRDVARHLLAGTAGESYIASVKATLQEGVKLPALAATHGSSRRVETETERLEREGLRACPRCGRTFGFEQFERHMNICKASGKQRPQTDQLPSASSSSSSSQQQQQQQQKQELQKQQHQQHPSSWDEAWRATGAPCKVPGGVCPSDPRCSTPPQRYRSTGLGVR